MGMQWFISFVTEILKMLQNLYPIGTFSLSSSARWLSKQTACHGAALLVSWLPGGHALQQRGGMRKQTGTRMSE